MNDPHTSKMLLLLGLAFLTISASPSFYVSAQQRNPASAQELYDDSVQRLFKKNYAKALEGADAALKVDSSFAPARLLKSQALVGLFKKKFGTEDKLMTMEEPFELLRQAAENLEEYLKLTPNASDAPQLKEQLESLRAYAQLARRADTTRTLFSPKEVTTKAKIVSRSPFAVMPSESKGTVTLMAVLAADGNVKYVMLLDPLDDKGMKEYFDAVSSVKFVPAVKDGRNVSTTTKFIFQFRTM